MRKLRPKLTYANVMATLALFIALGGTSYAATKIGTRQIANNSIRTQDIRNGTIRGRDVGRAQMSGREVRESRLGKVPRSGNADLLGGQSPGALRQRCPGGTTTLQGACFEAGLRPGASALGSAEVCASVGRRLGSSGELSGYNSTGRPLAAGGEWTSELAGSASAPTVTSAMALGNGLTETWLQADGSASRPFRCVTDPRD